MKVVSVLTMARCCIALYDLAPIHANTLGFKEGEKLLIVDIKTNDPHWWYAVNQRGKIGYVPRNYVGFLELTTPELLEELNKILHVLQVKAEKRDGFSPKHRTLYRNLTEFRDELATEIPIVNTTKRCVKSNDDNRKSSATNSVSEYSFYGTCTNTLCKSPPGSPPPSEISQITAVSSPTRRAAAQLKEVSSPVRSLSPSAKRPTSPTNEVSSPIRRVASPTRPVTSPTRPVSSPTNQPSPVNKVTSPVRRAASERSHVKDLSLPRRDTSTNIFENDITPRKDKIVVSPKSKARSTLAISLATVKISTNTTTQTDEVEKEEVTIPSKLVPEMVEQIRNRTKLSYKFSILSVGSIFETLQQHVPDSSEMCGKILTELENHQTNYKTIYQSQDKRRLQEIFDKIFDCKNDEQQRSWPIYEDELVINEYLQEIDSILGDADPRICCEVVQYDGYDAVNTLVIYYQMEPRRSLRFSLLKVFESLCRIDSSVIEHLIMSILPMELAREMEQHVSDYDRFKRCAKLLTIILSLVDFEPPRTVFDFLNKSFVSFLLGRVESVLDESIDEDVSNNALRVILALNCHLGKLDNFILDALSEKTEATALTEKLMLLINREDDPIQILHLNYSPDAPNSVLKFLVDIFSLPKCANHFYVNDIKVLLDIIVRQLTDLSPGTERRLTYHELLLSLIANTDYDEHRHLIDQISCCFSSILNEEEFPESEKDIVREIVSTFPELFTISINS